MVGRLRFKLKNVPNRTAIKLSKLRNQGGLVRKEKMYEGQF